MSLLPNKHVVITGGAGFIGSGVIKILNEKGFDNIIIVDEFDSSEKWKNLVGKKFIDLVHKDDLFRWADGRSNDIGGWIHLGACVSTVESDANYMLNSNYSYSVRLAEYALKFGHRFIYASSAATYGDGSKGFSDDHDKLDIYSPMNIYGFSKHLFDLWLYRRGVLDKVVGLKYFNVYGPNEFHKGRMASAILKMVFDAINKGVIYLFKSSDTLNYSDGDQARDFIYVKDAASMTAEFLYNQRCGIFNIGTGEPKTWKELANAVIHSINKDVKIEYIPMPDDLVGIYQNYTCADMRKSSGWMKPKFAFDEAIKDYVCNYILTKRYW